MNQTLLQAQPRLGGPMPNSAESKAMVGKFAAENGVTVAIRQYIKEFPALKEEVEYRGQGM